VKTKTPQHKAQKPYSMVSRSLHGSKENKVHVIIMHDRIII